MRAASLLIALCACRSTEVVVPETEASLCKADAEQLEQLGVVVLGELILVEDGDDVPVHNSWRAVSAELGLVVRGIPPEDAVGRVVWVADDLARGEASFTADLTCDAEGTPNPILVTMAFSETQAPPESFSDGRGGSLEVALAPRGEDPASCTDDSDRCLRVARDVTFVLVTE